MANRIISQTNFTSGQLSERLFSQTGLEQYSAGLKKATNCLITPQGPVKKRPGTYFVDYAGHLWEGNDTDEDPYGTSIEIELIPFKTTTGINYLLEFGNGFIRVFRDGGVVVQTAATITGITAATTGVITTSAAHGLSVGDYFKISGVSGMTEVNGDLFRVDAETATTIDMGQIIGSTNPSPFSTANYTAYTSGGSILTDFKITTSYTNANQLQYAQEGNKLYLVHPDHAPAVLEYTGGNTGWSLYDLDAFPPPTEELGTQPATTVTPGATTGTGVTFTAGASAFLQGDVGRQIVNLSGAGRASITGYTSATQVVCTIVEDFPSTSAIAAADWELDLSPVSELTPNGTKVGSIVNITSDVIDTATALNTFRSSDVGKYIYLNGGIIQITEYVSASSVNGEVLKTLKSKDESSIWTLEEPTWNSVRGYPTAIAFYEDRLWFGGTTVEPSTVWASETSLYDAFGIGSNDSDSISVQINSSRTSVVKWLAGSRDLVVGTDSSEITINSGSQGPITPSSIRQTPRTYTGSSGQVPVIIDNEVLYLQDDKVRSFRYDFNIDNFRAQDLTYLANDLFIGKTLTKIVFAQTPDSVIYVLASDGSLFAGTFVREQRVMAWSEFKTNGRYKDIQVLKNGDRDELWCLVKRRSKKGGQIVSGGVLRYDFEWLQCIERFADDSKKSAEVTHTDCSLSLNSVVVTPDHIRNIDYGVPLDRGIDDTTTITFFSVELKEGAMAELGLTASTDYTVFIENCDEAPQLNGSWVMTLSDNGYIQTLTANTTNNTFSDNTDWTLDEVENPFKSVYQLNPKNITITVGGFTTFSGFFHLPGAYVNMKGNGATLPQTQLADTYGDGVPYGIVTTTETISKLVVGLPYKMTIETLPLDIGDGGSGSLQNRTSRRVDIILRVHDSAIPIVNGKSVADRSPSTPMNLVQPLLDGVLNYGPQNWGTESTVSITDDSPQPILINGIYSIVEVNRKA